MHRLVVPLAVAGLLALLPSPLPAQPASAPLQVEVTTDRPAYTVGAAVTFTFTVTNPSDDPVTITFPSSQIYDIAVTPPAGGAPVWRWAQGRTFLTVITTRTIPAGGRLSFTERWDQRNLVGLQVLTGVYAVTGQLAGGGRPTSVPTLFLIGETQALPAGCATVTSAFPDGTPIGLVAAAFESRETLAGLWRFDGSRWQGWSPVAGAPNDLMTINSRDRLRICLTSPTRWITPV